MRQETVRIIDYFEQMLKNTCCYGALVLGLLKQNYAPINTTENHA